MNSTHTAQRNALDISTVCDLLFVNLNGPPLQHFNAEKYAAMWIKDGRHSASDKPSGRKHLTRMITYNIIANCLCKIDMDE